MTKATRLLSMVAALALLLMACQPADDTTATDTPTPATPTTPDVALETETEPGADVDAALLERLSTAADNTVDEGTARYEIQAHAGSDLGTGTGTDTGTDMASGMTVQGQVDFDEELRELEFESAQGPLTAIIDGDELYVEVPVVQQGQYARLSLQDLTQTGLGLADAAALPFLDPLLTLDALRDAVVEVSAVDDATATPTPDTDASPTPDTDASPTPDMDASPTPDMDASPTPDTDASPTPDTDASPTPDTDASPTPDTDASPTPDTDASPTPDTDASPTPDTDASPTPDMDTDTADARHLSVVIDLEQASQGEEANHFAALAEDHGIETVDMEVWIDEEDRVERIAYVLPVSDMEGQTGTQDDVTVVVTYTDFGTTVEIEVPDDAMVIDIDEQQLRQALPQDDLTGQPGTGTPTPDTGASPTPDTGASPTPDTGASPTPTPSPTGS